MGRLAGFSYREIVKIIKSFGFVFYRQAAGSHEIWFNPQTNRYTTIPNHTGDMPEGTYHTGDMPEGTLRAIFKQAGIEPEEFINRSD